MTIIVHFPAGDVDGGVAVIGDLKPIASVAHPGSRGRRTTAHHLGDPDDPGGMRRGGQQDQQRSDSQSGCQQGRTKLFQHG